MKMHEVEAAVKAQKLTHKPDSVKALEFAWKKRVAETTGATVILKAKELGQLKQFQKLCPDGKADKVLSAVLDDWIGYVKGVQSDMGLKTTPAVPSIGFLLQYASNAVIFAEPPKVESAKHDAPKVAIPAKSVQLISHNSPTTLEEILSILNK